MEPEFYPETIAYPHAGEHPVPTPIAEFRNEYVEIRGVWPVYTYGAFTLELIGKPLSISLEDARAIFLNS
jgi:hypothetical protein